MDVAVLESNHADAATREALRRLWDRAFVDRFDDIAADHAYGGVHVLARDGGHLIGHASAVPRLVNSATSDGALSATSKPSLLILSARVRASAGWP